MKPITIGNHRGWVGAFTRNQAEGAMPNGTPIVKIKGEEGDANPVGTKGRVLGSIWHPKLSNEIFYFVEWESSPHLAVGVVGWKIAAQ